MMANLDNAKDQPLAQELRRMVQALAAAGRASLPGSPDELLNSIVEAAARIFGAAAASILLVNEAEGILEFKVAYGASNRDLVGMRIPLNQGIAGYVAMSGQPIAISDVTQDTRFNRDFAKSTGYVPRSILATPLLVDDRVVGVMEVLDKINASSFGMQDMELLGLFARQAALAINQAQNIEDIYAVLLHSLKLLSTSDPDHITESLLASEKDSSMSGAHKDLLKIADQLNELSRLGEAEREMAVKILEAFSAYSQNKRHLSLGVPLR